jgi:hypothetical protein
MNRHVAKPKREQRLLPDDNVTEADMERHIRGNRAHINELIREAQDDIAAGRFAELEPLPVLLREARKYSKNKRAKRA